MAFDIRQSAKDLGIEKSALPSSSLIRFNATTSDPTKENKGIFSRYWQQAKEAPAEIGGQILKFGGDVGKSFESRTKNIGSSISRSMKGEQSGLEGGLQTFGQFAGAVGDVIGSGIGSAVGAAYKVGTTKEQEAEINKIKDEVFTALLNTPGGKDAVAALKKFEEWGEKNPRAKANLGAAFNIGDFALNFFGAGVAAKTGEKVGKGILEGIASGAKTTAKAADAVTGSEIAGIIRNVTGKAPEMISETVLARKGPVDVVGEILQGTTKDKDIGVRALSEIDTSGVKTFEDLSGSIAKRKNDLIKVVDEALEADKTITKLDDLATVTTTKTGKEVSRNFVKDALEGLHELYVKIADPVKEQDILDLIEKANTTGLTRKEINNLSREYGSELADKGFSARTGEALTSTNAQKFENIRSGIKDVARDTLQGGPAAVADAKLSDLIRVEELIEKNIEALNKIQQKVKPRNLVERAAGGVAKAIDLATLGGAKSFIAKFIPSNVGLKTMNYLDLEKGLEKNLKMFQKALKKGNNSELKKILEESTERDISKMKKYAPKEKPVVEEPLQLPAAGGSSAPIVTPAPTEFEKPAKIIAGKGQGSGKMGLNGRPRKFSENLNGIDKQKEAAAFSKIDKQLDKLIDKHKKLDGTFGGKLVNPDDLRPIIHDETKFGKYKGTEAHTVHEPASELANYIKQQYINDIRPDDVTVWTSGGPGNGKTTAIQSVDPSVFKNMKFGYDSVLGNFEKAVKDLDGVIKRGGAAYVPYVFRNIEDAWIEGVVGRAISKGRTVPLEVFLDGMEKAWKNIIQLDKHYKNVPSVRIRFIDNRVKNGTPKTISIEEVKKLNFTNLKEKYMNKLKALTKEKLDSGEISPEIYKGLIG